MFLGESFLQVQQRLLKDKEAKIRKALDRLRRKRLLLGQQRRRREIPVVSVVGYTNCGEEWARRGWAGCARRTRLPTRRDWVLAEGYSPR